MRSYQIPAQLIHLKRDWKSVLFWLVFPIVMSMLVISLTNSWQNGTKVPIALVVEEDTDLATNLVKEIRATSLLHVSFLDLDDALHKLEQHELDSVFVIREGYEENVRSNRRNGLIEAYSSNRSFAYQAVLEKVTSLVQQDAARSKAAFVLKHLYEEKGRLDEWNYDSIVDESRLRQKNSALLRTDFSYFDKGRVIDEKNLPFLQIWGIWALFAMIGSFFLTDWLQKENRPTMRSRWLFTAISFKQYAIEKFTLYLSMMIAVDFLTLFIFSKYYGSILSIRTIITLIAFRLTINLLAFFIASLHKQLISYYMSGLSIALLLTVSGGAIIPIDGLLKRWPWITNLSPVNALLVDSVSVIWLGGLLILLVLWIKRGATHYA